MRRDLTSAGRTCRVSFLAVHMGRADHHGRAARRRLDSLYGRPGPAASRGVLEFHGGFSRWLADNGGFSAMTLGHVIIGRDPWCLAFCREHEQAHVRQVERWGPAFIPAYLFASLLAWRRGEHYYRDNWFERDARRACGEPD